MNPYAPPQQVQPVAAYGYGVAGGYLAWPEGSDLAIQKDAALPSVCVKCGNGHAPQRRNQQFVWTPPWVFILFLVSPIIAAIVAMIVQKKGRLQLPLCDECHSRWKTGVLMVALGVVGFIFGLIAGIIIAANDWPEIGVPLLVGSIVVFVVALVVGNKRFLRASKVDERMITVRGIHQNAAHAILSAAAR
jgi:uncharacterized membrane protein